MSRSNAARGGRTASLSAFGMQLDFWDILFVSISRNRVFLASAFSLIDQDTEGFNCA